MFFYSSLCILIALAGHALALNITFGKEILLSRDLLAFPDGPYSAACQQPCMMANMTINSCAETDSQCLCQSGVANALQGCEQCLFTFLIAQNAKQADPRIGALTLLSGYAGACQTANFTLATAPALTLPPNWDGPVTEILSAPLTGVVVTFGALIGVFCIYVLSNLD